jgi:hypothetical protein
MGRELAVWVEKGRHEVNLGHKTVNSLRKYAGGGLW